MELSQALSFVGDRTRSVLVTERGSDGHPQLSNVMHHLGEDGVVRVSITSSRAKYKNLLRTPWAALHITSDDFWSWVVVEGEVSLAPVAQAPDDDTVEELVAYYRALSGEHDDWDAYRASMVAEGRTVVRLRPGRAYGQLP
ncbi:putative pyridoxine/pyridoxamine 5'-phosphate oxidase [Marmoricola endophyticus]|uniref:Pyridoxine/pyridoxamine 5'-phosphate oxidase n=1 Tax=Marmoricola endophyticus TaxID=2040280 RepID=A0A917BIE5_9ACTN|nr:PPOX class F420-dependent oxidoreductase [Marmoricola endophyticus]GGF46791.1 putative pyridoxine/pyridoxamine 5'-phosphate oxidase [Marmoricola endophyticus]